MVLPSLKILFTYVMLLVLTSPLCYCRPWPGDEGRSDVKQPTEKSTENGSVGGDLDNLISDMLNRIIQRRLENLLQGISSPNRKDFELLESSELLFPNEELNTNSAFEEGEQFLEISLPITVTEIPKEVFTNLPGTFWLHLAKH